jgi:hypothetical protein
MAEEIDDPDGESIGDELRRRFDAAPTREEKLALMAEFVPGTPEITIKIMEGYDSDDVIDLSKSGGEDPREE